MLRIGAVLAAWMAVCVFAPGALAATVRVDRSGGLDPQVIFEGTGADENVSVSRTVPPPGGHVIYRFSTTGAVITPGAGCTRTGPDTMAECDIATFRERQGRMLMGGGSDTVFTSAQILLEGQGGDDDLFGVAMDGGPGNDGLRAALSGSVFLVAAGDGTDTILGSTGFDALSIREPGTLDMNDHANDTITNVEALGGTGGDDTIVGDSRAINGVTGVGWQISGGNGDDRLTAGSPPGGSNVSGGNGEDVVTGGSGPDTLGGGNERDVLDGGGGSDNVSGGDDDDTLDGGAGTDQLSGGDDDDVLRSDDGGVADTLSCGNGTDRTVADLADSISSDCELSGEDRDGDALLDEWEVDGIDVDGDETTDLDLAAMGADPDRKDVFLELDFMPPHAIQQAAVAEMIQSFADAPVPNPDGSTGIELHVDNGPGSVMDPSSGALWGSRSRQTAIAHQPVVGSLIGDQYQWGDFDVLKLANFDDARIPAFHYAISAHAHDGTTSGIARGAPGSDLLVTLGAGCQAQQGTDCTMTAQEQAGTLMHELGHSLGLRHGGDDDTPYKPSYISVMNYAFQLSWLVRTDGSRSLDFARFGLSMDETALDETRGFGQSVGSEPARFITAGFCPNGTQAVWFLVQTQTDFDCDGTITGPGPVSSDTNGDGDLFEFEPFVDWPELVFGGGAIGALGRSVPGATTQVEPAMEELEESRQAIEAHVASTQQPPAPPAPPPPPPPPPPAGSTGGGPPSGGSPGGTTARPRLSGLRVRPGSLRAARRGPSVPRRGGIRIAFRLDRAVRVVFTVQRRQGRRWKAVRGSFAHAGRAGANALRFSGRIGGARLRPGRHRLVATPRGGAPARAEFAVRR